MFIPDPDLDFYSSLISDPGVKKAPSRSGSVALVNSLLTIRTITRYFPCFHVFKGQKCQLIIPQNKRQTKFTRFNFFPKEYHRLL